MQGKLEEKGFANARQYYKMRQYKAAIVSFENFQKNFPDSKFTEEAQYLIILSQFSLAQQSIYSRQEERYRDVIENYKELIDKYPNSTFLRDAERVYSESLEKLTKFKSNKNI
jgi:outer membrane protein assembly factor BamD